MMDKRSKTSAINGLKGGRPKELLEFNGSQQGEVWRPITGYGKYFVSNMGKILSVKGKTPLILSAHKNNRGYYRVGITQDGRSRHYLVHRLVLSAFVGECPEGMEGSHINGRCNDNRLDNLAWETAQQNNTRREDHGRARAFHIPYVLHRFIASPIDLNKVTEEV